MPSESHQETVLRETREKVLKFIKQGGINMESGMSHDLLKMINQYDSNNGTVQPASSLNNGVSSSDQDTLRNGLSSNGIIPMDLQTVKLDLFQQLSNNNPQTEIESVYNPPSPVNPLPTSGDITCSPVRTLANTSTAQSPVTPSFTHSSPSKMEVTLTPPHLPAGMNMDISQQQQQSVSSTSIPVSVYTSPTSDKPFSIQSQTENFTSPNASFNVHNSVESSFSVVTTPAESFCTDNVERGNPLLSMSDVPQQEKSFAYPHSEVPTFGTLSSDEIKKQTEPRTSGSVLHQLLTQTNQPDYFDLTNTSSPDTNLSSPDYPNVDSPSSLSSPNPDPNTQATLINQTNRVRIDSDHELPLHPFKDIVWNISDEPKGLTMGADTEIGVTTIDQSDASKVFDADPANPKFVFQKFGKQESDTDLFNVGSIKNDSPQSIIHSPEDADMPPPKGVVVTRSQTHSKRVKEPSLNQNFPARSSGYELQILHQPEEQHRARYLTEGSRGAVKNRSQDGHPMVKLYGNTDSAVLQVFIGNDAGKTIRPHGFYQACRVCGKNSTPARERDIDGTTVIEMDLTPANDMTAMIDNVGILKLRNADVEQRIGLTKAKKKSTKARMIFRAVFKKADGNSQTLQISSSTILCTQPVGQPEICKMSHHEWSVEGKDELFLIGKNFIKGTRVVFREMQDDIQVLWEKEAEIDKDYFQPTHLICTIPPYKDASAAKPVHVQIVVQSAGKQSDPQKFVYTPGMFLSISPFHYDSGRPLTNLKVP